MFALSVAVIVNVCSPSIRLLAVVSVPFVPRGSSISQCPSVSGVTFQLELVFKSSLITSDVIPFVSVTLPLNVIALFVDIPVVPTPVSESVGGVKSTVRL